MKVYILFYETILCIYAKFNMISSHLNHIWKLKHTFVKRGHNFTSCVCVYTYFFGYTEKVIKSHVTTHEYQIQIHF